jgi:hypothetical protein
MVKFASRMAHLDRVAALLGLKNGAGVKTDETRPIPALGHPAVDEGLRILESRPEQAARIASPP